MTLPAATSKSNNDQTRVKSPRVGFFGLFGVGNLGNDGSLESMVRVIRRERPNAQLVCVCAEPDKVEAAFGMPAVRINYRPASDFLVKLDRLLLNIPRELASLAATISHLRRFDVMIIPGTGILDDFGTGPKGMPYWIFRWCLLARLLGKKTAFVSIGAGPIREKASRWLMKNAAGMAQYRSYRDQMSVDFMESIGSDASADAVYPDIAFALPAPDDLRTPAPDGSPLTIGVGVMSYNGWRADKASDGSVQQEYRAKMKQFISGVLNEGHRVRILTGELSDHKTAEALQQSLRTDHPDLDKARLAYEPAYSLHDVMAHINDTDVVVATRFHNVVCALKLGRPTIGIDYSGKNEAVLAEMGLGDFVQDIEKLDADGLLGQLRELLADRKTYEAGVCKARDDFIARLAEQEQKLVQRFL